MPSYSAKKYEKKQKCKNMISIDCLYFFFYYYMNSFFVGDKLKPSFLIEVITKQKIISIYKPDKYSKNEDFYEKYSLGKLLIQTKYNDIIFVKKPVSYKNFLFSPEIIFMIKNKYLIVSKTIKETDFIK